MNLLDSLLDAIVRLEGDALVMHVGEKPYVVTTTSPLTAPRGPLSWGQVELSSRVLTPDAVLGMLGQILPLEDRQTLEEIGAVEYQIPPPAGVEERFSVVAARGGDDIWLEVRRRTKPQPVADAAKPPATADAPTTGVMAAATPAEAPAAAHAGPIAVPAPKTAELVIEQEEEEEEEDDVFEVVPDIWQSAPTDDEVDALLASMAPRAAVQGSAPPGVETPGVETDLEVPVPLDDEQPLVLGADAFVSIPIEVAAEREAEPHARAFDSDGAIEIPLVLDAVADAPPAADAVTDVAVDPAEQPLEIPGTTSPEYPAGLGVAAAPQEAASGEEAEPALVASIRLVEAPDAGAPAVAEAAVLQEVPLQPITPVEEPETVLATPAVAEPSAIADARAAFEAFTLTAPEAVSQLEEEPEPVPASAGTFAQGEVLPFDVEPLAEVEPVDDVPAAIAADVLAVVAPEVPTAVAADVPPAVAVESPAVAETRALGAAAAALDAAAAIEAFVNADAARAVEPADGAARRADDVPLREPSAPAVTETHAPEAAPAVQEPPAPVEEPVARPAIAARHDVRSVAKSRAVPPVSEAPAPPPPAVVPVAPPRVEAPAAASTTPPRPAPVPAHGTSPAQAGDPRPALVVPISRSPVRPEAPMHAPAASLAPLEHMLRIAAARGASTVYVVAQSKPMIRVDGEISVLDSEPLFSTADVERVVMDLAPTRGREPSGPVEWMSDVPEVGRVRCVTFRDHRGPGVIFRMIPPRAISVDQLGLSPEVQALCALPDGLVLVAGARASGKSTLLSAFVDLINRTRSDHVITVESQISFVHESRKSFVSQREVRGDAEAAASAVRSAFREDPDVLVIEDLRTAEIVSVAIEAAESGRLVLGSLSAPSTVAAIERLVELFSPERRAQVQTALAGALRGVVAQVLLRKMKGGRIAAREVLLNTPAVATLVLENRMFQLPVALEAGRRHGMVPLNDSLAALVRDGTVHVAEAYRKALDREALLPILKREGIDTSFAERLA